MWQCVADGRPPLYDRPDPCTGGINRPGLAHSLFGLACLSDFSGLAWPGRDTSFTALTALTLLVGRQEGHVNVALNQFSLAWAVNRPPPPQPVWQPLSRLGPARRQILWRDAKIFVTVLTESVRGKFKWHLWIGRIPKNPSLVEESQSYSQYSSPAASTCFWWMQFSLITIANLVQIVSCRQWLMLYFCTYIHVTDTQWLLW